MRIAQCAPLNVMLNIFDMKRIIIVLFFGSLQLNSWAQSCIPDYILFFTQNQVDSFQINYPGCTEIEGNVIIMGNNIVNLDGLLNLTSIEGYLLIEKASALICLYGLNNVSFIGGYLRIDDNEALINLVGLNGLVSIGGSVTIMRNPSLLHLTGLNNLTSIGGDLNIGCSNYSWTGNPLLTNLTGLTSLSSIGNYLRICSNHGLTDLSGIENLTNVGNIYIAMNDNLSSIAALQGVSNVNGYITIALCNSLNSLIGLSNLTSVGSLRLSRLTSLYDLSGLEQLNIVANNLTISENFSLNNISALYSLTYVGGKLFIESNYNLINLSGLENLTEIGGGLEIRSNYSLSSIDALSSVTSIGGDLIIERGSFTDLTGLSGVTSIDGNLVIGSNNSLTSLTGIENINPSSIKNLEISWLVSLTDCAFPNICEYLTDPKGVVDIYRNGNPCNNPGQIAKDCGITLPCLPYGNYHFIYQYEVDSFQTYYPGCTDLEGNLILHGGLGGSSGNYNNLNGLSVITSINGILAIFGANYLTSLKGIDNIDASSISDLYIMSSPYLSECEVQSICDYLANPNGGVAIEENAYGCNSPEEVQAACDAVSIQEQKPEPFFRIFPNPASQYLFIDNRSGYNIDKILIYNTVGQIINLQDYKEPFIDISEFDQGIYILEITTRELVRRLMFIVSR
jgi:hypothetical protein